MFKTTMTGSFYRTKEIVELLGKSKTGEVSEKNSKEIETAEKLAGDTLMVWLNIVAFEE